LIHGLAQQGIETAKPVYLPLHRYYDLQGYAGAEKAWKTHLSLPIHPSLHEQDVQRVCHALQQNMKDELP
jgi:dTDP-4-amino-4,6-dideoxygalactose transaminase